jgi:hypothetical protein
VSTAMTAQVLTINNWLPEPLSNVHADHWRKRERKLKAAQVMIWAAGKHAALQPMVGRVRVTFVLVFPVNRRRDADGLHTRIKGCLDGLVKGGWLVDDSTEHIDLVVRAETRPGIKQLEITLEPLS